MIYAHGLLNHNEPCVKYLYHPRTETKTVTVYKLPRHVDDLHDWH